MRACILAILSQLLVSTVVGFAPSILIPSPSIAGSSLTSIGSTEESSATTDPFETYQPGQATLAYRDEAFGEGESLEEGDVVKVAFTGTLYPSGQVFAKNDDFVFQLGEGKTMPGFDAALGGTKIGSKRIIRVPPVLAFGDRGNAPKIPPNADLEFTVEVKEITRGKIQGEIAKFGPGRLAGLIACAAVLAVTPMLS